MRRTGLGIRRPLSLFLHHWHQFLCVPGPVNPCPLVWACTFFFLSWLGWMRWKGTQIQWILHGMSFSIGLTEEPIITFWLIWVTLSKTFNLLNLPSYCLCLELYPAHRRRPLNVHFPKEIVIANNELGLTWRASVTEQTPLEAASGVETSKLEVYEEAFRINAWATEMIVF